MFCGNFTWEHDDTESHSGLKPMAAVALHCSAVQKRLAKNPAQVGAIPAGLCGDHHQRETTLAHAFHWNPVFFPILVVTKPRQP